MIDSLTENEKFETEELNEKADTVEKCEDATSVNKEYEDIIRTKMKNIICIAYQQSKVFKRFRKKKVCFDGKQKHHDTPDKHCKANRKISKTNGVIIDT